MDKEEAEKFSDILHFPLINKLYTSLSFCIKKREGIVERKYQSEHFVCLIRVYQYHNRHKDEGV